MATAISDFTVSERQSLAMVALAIDDIAPEFRVEALGLIERVSELDEVSQDALANAIEALARERRWKDLIAYLQSGRPLVDLQAEICQAIDKDPVLI